jgi:hypothetical protein
MHKQLRATIRPEHHKRLEPIAAQLGADLNTDRGVTLVVNYVLTLYFSGNLTQPMPPQDEPATSFNLKDLLG